MMPLRMHILAFTLYDSLSCFLLAVFDKTLSFAFYDKTEKIYSC